MKGFLETAADLRKSSIASLRVYAEPLPALLFTPSTNFMLIGTSAFMTSMPYFSFVNSSMLRLTLSGLHFAYSSPFSSPSRETSSAIHADPWRRQRSRLGDRRRLSFRQVFRVSASRGFLLGNCS